jgi:hypothetical protein
MVLTSHSVVIQKINVADGSALETEDYPPVSTHTHGPETFAIPFQWVKAKTRKIHFFGELCLVEMSQDRPYSGQ